MSTIAPPAIAPTTGRRHADMPSTRRYWIAVAIAAIGLSAGLAYGIAIYRDSQRHLDSFDRASIPGTVIVDIDEPTGRVLYYEGDDTVRFEDLTLSVTDPSGNAVEVDRYQGEMVYETVDLTKGTAIAMFTADEPGRYEVEVRGVDNGELTIGDSFARRVLPGVLTGLGIAGFGLIAGLVVAVVTLVQRSDRATAKEAS
jgi:hypothetical protein